MPKKCKVLLNNDVVAVIQYDDYEVQIQPVEEGQKYVYIEKNGYSYTVVNEKSITTETIEKPVSKQPAQRKKAKRADTQEIEQKDEKQQEE